MRRSKHSWVGLILVLATFLTTVPSRAEEDPNSEPTPSLLQPRMIGVAAMGAAGLHIWSCASHCSPGRVPIVQLAYDQPMVACAAYLASGAATVLGYHFYRRRR